MNQDQNPTMNATQSYPDCHTAHAQARLERQQAKQAARQARRLARQERPRRDWTFEIRLGDQVCKFSWQWGRELETQVTAAPVEPVSTGASGEETINPIPDPDL